VCGGQGAITLSRYSSIYLDPAHPMMLCAKSWPLMYPCTVNASADQMNVPGTLSQRSDIYNQANLNLSRKVLLTPPPPYF
jgi:hypothetical protein